jgi:sugar/nucleoside kinase (ribokinase family)
LFDTNYDSSAAAVQAVKAILPLVDIFLPNALELKLLSGINDVELACTTIGVPMVVVKLGKAGCFVYSYSMGYSGYIETLANDSPIDLNGAGDFWAAGFITELLRTGNLMDAARFGNEVASMAIDYIKLAEKLKTVEMLA